MVQIKCNTSDTVKLQQLTLFQGDLKKRTPRVVHQLANSIRDEGLLMPFAVWLHDDVYTLLDGHGRYNALMDLALEDNSIFEQNFPVVFISADTEEQARKELLQITSSYGTITKEGAAEFCKTIADYHAPAINKLLHRKLVHHKQNVPNTMKTIHIAVPQDKYDAVIDMFKQVDYIKLL